MHRIYFASNLIEAKLLKDLLDEQRIPSQIQNQCAIGAVGELPFTQIYPEIWVKRQQDIDKAKLVIQSFQNTDTSAEVICDKCGEVSPETFEFCWNCGH